MNHSSPAGSASKRDVVTWVQQHLPCAERVMHGDHVPKIVHFETDARGCWAFLSSSWTEVLGYDVQQSLGMLFLDFVHPEDRPRNRAAMQPWVCMDQPRHCGAAGDCCRHEIRYVARDGSVRWMEVFAHRRLDERGTVIGTSGVLADVTPLRDASDRLSLAAKVFEGTSDGIVVLDLDGRIVEANKAFVALTGYTRDMLVGQSLSMLFTGAFLREAYQSVWDGVARTGHWSGEIWSRHANGHLTAGLLRLSTVSSNCGEHLHYVAIVSDITERKRQKEALHRLAHFDALTGLPNRALALERMGQYIAGAAESGRQVAVCCVDLDDFLRLNERVGRVQGDALLVAVAKRLRDTVRTSDLVARLGGDEFLLLLSGISSVDMVHQALQRVLQALAQPYGSGGQEACITASIGVALYPDQGHGPEQLLRLADQSMYQAKRQGKNCICMGAQDGTPGAAAQGGPVAELRLALATQQLCLHYQPKVCAQTGVLMGAEALVRWQHPQRGLLAPGAFLPSVANTPLETELDWWVMRTALQQLAQWRQQGHSLQLSINIAPRTLLLPELADTVDGILRETEREACSELGGIELEVVETAALADLDTAINAMKACARHGISFALDDFGTGYSSLSYLRRLPANTLKIDRSFVSNMLVNECDLHIVRAVVNLAEAFGVATVAEGVETDEHARTLAALGCQQLQGYGIARPMPAQALEAWARNQRSNIAIG